MPRLTLPTLKGKIHDDAEKAIRQLAAALEAVAVPVPAPAPLTVPQVQQALQATGSYPLNLTGLPGASGSTPVIFDTHANRLAKYPAATQVPGQFYFEVDRIALYAIQVSLAGQQSWALLAAAMAGSAAGKPGDLGAQEEGFLFFAQDQSVVYYWSGSVWHWETGTYTDTFANRPAAGGTSIAGGFRFAASDYGYQEWEYDLAHTRWQFAGGGIPLDGTLPIGPLGLGAQDVGFRYHSTDFDRLYVWTGSGWTDVPGQPERGLYAPFDTVPGTGWFKADGSLVTGSTATGGTGSYTTRNLVTGQPFVRGNATSGGSGGAATATATIPAGSNTGNDSGTQTVQSGTGATVPAEPHTHPIGALTSNPFAILPPYQDFVWYVRL